MWGINVLSSRQGYIWDFLTLPLLDGRVGRYRYQMQKGWMEGGVVFVMGSMDWVFRRERSSGGEDGQGGVKVWMEGGVKDWMEGGYEE